MPVEGVDRTIRNLERVERILIEALNDAMEDEADRLLLESNALAPQLSGDLIADSKVDEQQAENGLKRYSVNYGDGPSRPYALIQHEAVLNPGPITRLKPGAGRKYLSRAFDKWKTGALRRIRSDLQRALERDL